MILTLATFPGQEADSSFSESVPDYKEDVAGFLAATGKKQDSSVRRLPIMSVPISGRI